MYYYTDRFYAGISTPKLIENKVIVNKGTNTVEMGKEQRHFYAIAGSVFDINNAIKLRPTSFLKVTPAAPIEADLTALFIFHDRVECGPMFRTGDAFGLLLGYNITPQMRFGYSFDWSFTNKTGRYNQGSHEVMLRYDFIYKDKSKVYSPRYF
jgi:type IX secretion system PorP/SprF family membrane protein